MKKVFLFLIIMSIAMPLQAQFILSTYNEERQYDSFKIFINGVGSGLLAANAMVKHRKQPPLFCPPDKLGLGIANYMSIIDGEIQDNKSIYTLDTPIQLILLKGLQRVFPCDKK